MLKNRNIIIFGEDWGRFPSTTQHIGKVLLKFNRIMWVGSLAHRKPNFSIKDFVRILEKLRSIITFNKKEKRQLKIHKDTSMIQTIKYQSYFYLKNLHLKK